MTAIETIQRAAERDKAKADAATAEPWKFTPETSSGWMISGPWDNPICHEAWHGGPEHEQYRELFLATGTFIAYARTGEPRWREAALELAKALADITDPIGKFRRDAKEQGGVLDGAMAIQLASNAEVLKQMARSALTAVAELVKGELK